MTGPGDIQVVWVPCGACAGQGRVRLHIAGPSYLCGACLGMRERLPAGSVLLGRNDGGREPPQRPFHGWKRPG